MIRLQNVYYEYSKNHPVLNGINLDIKENEKVGILGESGAGKTTLVKLILNEIKSIRGKVNVDSKRVLPIYQHAFESFDRHYTIQQSLEELLIYYNKVKTSFIKEQILNYLDAFHLSHQLLQKYPNEVSGGQLQRLNIIRTLLAQPDILICDEITSNLDVIAEQKVIDFLLKSEIDIPQTIIVISHDLSVLQRLTNRIIVLKDELIVDDFKTNELFDSERNEYTKLLIETFE